MEKVDYAAIVASLENPDKTIPFALGLAAHIAASRRRHQHGSCIVCDKPFEGTARRTYCGSVCRNRAWRSQRVWVRVD